jgi:hypothetical protein
VVIRPAFSPRTLVNAVALLIAISIVGLLVARGVWVLAYPQWGIIGGLCAVIVLVSAIGALDVIAGRTARAWLLVAVEAVAAIVVFSELGFSFERATEDVPVIGPLFAGNVWAPRYEKTDPFRAAAYRVEGHGGGAVLAYLDLPAQLVIQRNECGDVRAGEAAYVAGKEPLIEVALDRTLGACAAHDGNTAVALADYYAGSARTTGSPARVHAASDAEADGFEPIALAELRLGMGDPTQRAEICREMVHARASVRETKFAVLLARYTPPAGTACPPAR